MEKNISNLYSDYKKGLISEGTFKNAALRMFPYLITPRNSTSDTVHILKSKRLLTEAEEFYDPAQLAVGTREEMEHTDDPKVAEKIAKDHLDEDPAYYSKLHLAGLDKESEALKGLNNKKRTDLPKEVTKNNLVDKDNAMVKVKKLSEGIYDKWLNTLK